MPETTATGAEDSTFEEKPPFFALGRGQIVLWVVVTLALIPAMVFIRHVHKEVRLYDRLLFADAAREAMQKGDFGRAEQICTGALRSWNARVDYVGLAHLVRAEARQGQGLATDALSDLDTAADKWLRMPWLVDEEGRSDLYAAAITIAKDFAAAGDAPNARGALAAGGRGSSDPAGFLAELKESLDKQTQDALWPDGPYLIVEDFEEGSGTLTLTPEQHRETQGRDVVRIGLDDGTARTGTRSGVVEVTAPRQDGTSLYVLNPRIRVGAAPCGIRMYVRQKVEAPLTLQAVYWSDITQRTAVTKHEPVKDGEWLRFDVVPGAHPEAFAPGPGGADGEYHLTQLGLLVEGPANTLWIDDVEVYLQ